MDWSPQQTEALERVAAWAEARTQQTFYLGGYAGSGKTTLAKFFAEQHGGVVEFGAYTGKAALVLHQKGCLGARTIHSLIYLPAPKSKRQLLDLEEELSQLGPDDPDRRLVEKAIKEEKERVKKPSWSKNENSALLDADLLIIDEVSMVDEKMGEDLVSFGVPILVLGDPAQLPPVAKSTGYFTKRKPDFMLTEVHRQAAGSPVLQMATRVRNGETLEVGSYGSSRVLPAKGVKAAEAATFDQIICGKNATRKAINKRIRQVRGFDGDLPVEGDRLVCLRNDKNGLLNGSFWEVIDSSVSDEDRIQLFLRDPETHETRVETAWRHEFEGRELPWYQAREAQEFDYGYAVTCHKAQGSQWNNVLIYDESYIARKDRRKWLYTALTRAAESVTIVRT